MRAELARVIGVVAEARRVQRQRHVAVEPQPAAGARSPAGSKAAMRRRRALGTLDGCPCMPAIVRPMSPQAQTVPSCSSPALRAGSAAAIALELAATPATWRCTTPLRRQKPRRPRRVRAGRRGRAFQADLADEAHLRGAAAGGAARFGQWTRWSTTPRASSTTTATASTRLDGRATGAPTPRRAIVLAQALRRAPAGRRTAPAASSTCWTRSCGTRTPTTSQLHLSKAALEAATTCWRRRSRRAARGRRGARGHAHQPHAGAGQSSSRPKLTPLGRSSTPEDVARAVRFVMENAAPSPAPPCWWTAAST